MRSDLGVGWVIRREMDARSQRPPWYDGFAYEGLSVPLLLLAFGAACLIVCGLNLEALKLEAVGTGLVVVAFWPYVVYLSLAAAGMVAGGLAVDRNWARHMPVSAWSLLVGKLVGSVLPLFGELLILVPFLCVAVDSDMVQSSSVWHLPGLVVIMAGAILLGGLLGAACVRASDPPRAVACGARTLMWTYLTGFPVVVCVVVGPLATPMSELTRPAVVSVWAIHPFCALFLLSSSPNLSDLAVAAAFPGLVAAMLFGVAWHKARSLLA